MSWSGRPVGIRCPSDVRRPDLKVDHAGHREADTHVECAGVITESG